MALALVEHFNLTEDTAAAVTWPFLDDLEKNIIMFEPHYLKIDRKQMSLWLLLLYFPQH